MTDDIAELVALVNARMPEGSAFRLDPERPVHFGQHWASDHYWTLTDGKTTHQWQQARSVAFHPVERPFVVWTDDPVVALFRVLAVERHRAAERAKEEE
jgi:hypothetical protein